MVVFLDASRNFYLFIYGGRLVSENKINYEENKEDLWKGHGNYQSKSSNVLGGARISHKVVGHKRW